MKISKIFPVYILLLLFTSLNTIKAQYCIPTTTYPPSSYNMYIDSVSLADIQYRDSYSPADTCYNDYTQYYMTLLTRGQNYNLTIRGGPYYNYMHYVAWIDYNGDYDFTDTGETLGEFITTSANQVFTINFTVPLDADILTTRLRIRCVYYYSPDPCSNYGYGEAEDYTVSISDFLKTGTGIEGGYGDIDFFNYNTDGDYDLIFCDDISYTDPLLFALNSAGNFSLFDYINGDLPEVDNDNLSYHLCDLNNDNALDLLLTYRYDDDYPRTLYYEKQGSTLSLVATDLPDLMRGSTAAADLNNDGRQDVIICGQDVDEAEKTFIYMNTPDGFILVNDDLKGVNGQIITADFDNDMDIDILLTGNDAYGNTNGILYRNDNNWIFTNIFADLNKISWTEKAESGDFNNDGLLDIVIGTKVYRNEGGENFTEVFIDSELEFGINGAGHWSDVDNDGYQELVSQDYNGVIILEYNGVDSFLIDQKLLVDGTTINTGDYNDDNKQDIVINYYQEIYILKNQTAVSNSAPDPPEILTSDVGSLGYYSVKLSWEDGLDDLTTADALTYNLRVGTSPGANDIVSPMTSPTDYSLLKPGMGNVYHNNSWYLKNLSPGTYYWSVQTVDKSDLASEFSEEQQFEVLAPLSESSFDVLGTITDAGPGADFDADNDIDLILYDTLLAIYEQVAPFNYDYHIVDTRAALIGINDFNYDNLPDLIARHNKIPVEEEYDSLVLYINKGDFTFEMIKLDTLTVSSAAAADFDNDGDIDILVHDEGYFLFENEGELEFNRIHLPMEEILSRYTTLSPVDIDRDNDMDFLVSGITGNFSGECMTYLYTNSGNNNFTFSQALSPGLGPTRFMPRAGIQVTISPVIKWNDLNFDAYPDLIITGNDSYQNANNLIFLNNASGILYATDLSPRPTNKFSTTWIDFNTDGYLDVIIPKMGWTVDNIIYLNDGNNGYTGFNNLADSLDVSMYISAIDVDNDNDKDILCTYKVNTTLSYKSYTKIYTNNDNFINHPPEPPSSITHEIDIFTVILNWSKGLDDLTSYEGNTYNIWVGTTDSTPDIVSPLADMETGYRYIEDIGNAGTNLSWTLKDLPLGKYYWSVQTIDNSLQGSAWVPVSTFELRALTADFDNDVVCLGFETHFIDESVSTDDIDSWEWDFGDGHTSSLKNPSHIFAESGNHSVKLTVVSGESVDSLTKAVYVNPVPEANFNSDVVCSGEATTFTNTTALNGTTISTWQWDFGDGQSSALSQPPPHGFLNAGEYQVWLKAYASNGCADSVSKTVNVGSYPVAVVSANAPLTFCKGDSVTLSVPYNSTYTYNWMSGGVSITGGNTEIFAAKLTGNYSVEVINPVGNCSTTSSSVEISALDAPAAPVIFADGDLEFCQGDSVLLSVTNTPGYNYQWKLNGGAVGTDSSIHAAKLAGEYSLTVSNTTGCAADATNTITVTVNPSPSLPTVNLSGPTTFCNGDSVVLSVTNNTAYSYQWLNNSTIIAGASSNSLIALSSGSYTLNISNSSGCNTLTTPVEVTVKPMPYEPAITSDNYTAGNCMPETPVRLYADPENTEYSYQWYRNGIPVTAETLYLIEDFLTEGDYTLIADLDGCTAESDAITIVYKDAPEKPSLSAQGPSVWYLICGNTSAAEYKWYCNDKLITDADDYYYIAGRKMGEYQVSIRTEPGGCFTRSDIVNIPTGDVGMEDVDPFEDLSIYPNPTNGLFTAEMENQITGNLLIRIIGQDGKELFNFMFEKTSVHLRTELNLNGQPKGSYLIIFEINKHTAVRIVIID